MAIYNLGSINADMLYRVPHFPAPGETLSAQALTQGLGGKGTNMSVAAARAGAKVTHIGAVGPDGQWALDKLQDDGIETAFVKRITEPTGHAIIALDRDGENAIILFPGANAAVPANAVTDALAQAGPADTFICQNETNLQKTAAELAKSKGMRVVYAAAPFSAEAVARILPYLDMLVLNQIEAEQLQAATGKPVQALGIRDVVVTLGGDGCLWFDELGQEHRFSALPVQPVDTTGAGDTFTGYLIAGLDLGLPVSDAIKLAGRAAALMVTRLGTANVIPTRQETNRFSP